MQLIMREVDTHAGDPFKAEDVVDSQPPFLLHSPSNKGAFLTELIYTITHTDPKNARAPAGQTNHNHEMNACLIFPLLFS